MALSQFLGYREFVEPNKIKDLIAQYASDNENSQDLESAKLLLIFETSKQRTWLIATKKRLYCILDDLRREEPRVRWSMEIDKITPEEIISHPSRKNKGGLLDIGPRKNWLYSKRLFEAEDAADTVRRFLGKDS